MTGAMLRPLARPTLRGSARRDGRVIIYTCTGIDSTRLDGADSSSAGVHLSQVRTPDEALAFVRRYGPIGHLGDLILDEDTIRGTTELRAPVEIRENVESILDEARDLYELLFVAKNAQKAAEGDDDARERLERHAARRHLSENLTVGLVPDDTPDQPSEMWLSHLVAAALSEQIGHARPHLEVVGPGRFEVRLLSATLRDFCYVNVAQILSAQERIDTCPECARIFVVDDGRQRYCTPQCAGRARFKRFKAKKADDKTTTRKK